LDEKILRLKELQRITLALRAIDLERQQGPARLAALEESFEEVSASVGAVKHRHDALRAECATLEHELKDLHQKLAKFQAALMEVKNNKEYSAVLKEIDTAKVDISKHDEGLLARMQEMETLQADLPEVEAKLAVEIEAFDKERAAIASAMKDLEDRSRQLLAERQVVEKALPRDILSTFHRVAEARQGVSMARVVDSVCTACNVRLRPQMYNEVRRGDTLLTCDSCRRFLYYEPPAEPAGDSPAASTQKA
jgi:predicted  nucleic acid-binding Zn-ribbon protein